MSRRNNILAIFERPCGTDDHFGLAKGTWEEVTKAWVFIEPIGVDAQRTEFVDASQVKSTRKSIVKTTCTRTMLNVTTDCRMKVAKPNVVNESDPKDDANFRIFEISSIVNVQEKNRNLEISVVERT